jgi:hypothetical protein
MGRWWVIGGDEGWGGPKQRCSGGDSELTLYSNPDAGNEVQSLPVTTMARLVPSCSTCSVGFNTCAGIAGSYRGHRGWGIGSSSGMHTILPLASHHHGAHGFPMLQPCHLWEGLAHAQ